MGRFAGHTNIIIILSVIRETEFLLFSGNLRILTLCLRLLPLIFTIRSKTQHLALNCTPSFTCLTCYSCSVQNPFLSTAVLLCKSTNTVMFVIYHLRASAHTTPTSFSSRQPREFSLNKPQQWWLKWIIWSDLRHSILKAGEWNHPSICYILCSCWLSTGGQLLFPGTNQTSYAHNGARKYSQDREGSGQKIRSGINQLM